MSSGDSTSDIIQSVEQTLLYQSITTSVMALYAYDYILTFSDEVKYIWSRGFDFMLVVYQSARLLPMIQIFFDFWPGAIPPLCDVWAKTTNVCVVLTHVSIMIILGGRVYAVSSNSRPVAAILLFFAIVYAGVNLFTSAVERCVAQPTVGDRAIHIGDIVENCSRFAFDLVVSWVTIVNTYHFARARKDGLWHQRHPSIGEVILKQGVLYFLTVMLLELAVLILTFKHSLISDGFIGPFALPLSSIVVCHFFIELRARGAPRQPSSMFTLQQLSTLRFAAEAIDSALQRNFGDSDCDAVAEECNPGEPVPTEGEVA